MAMKVRMLEAENEKLQKAAIYEKERSMSAKRLEGEVKRLNELIEHFRFEAQSDEGSDVSKTICNSEAS